MCPVSALAEYVMNAVNPVLPPGYKVTWDHVITRTPWMKKQLFNFTSEEEWKMHHQAIPMAGISSDLGYGRPAKEEGTPGEEAWP